jgi:hypothetical protein
MGDVSPQAMEMVSSIDVDRRGEAVSRIGEGQSIQQVRAAVKQGMVIDPRVDPADEDESDEALLGKLLAQRKKLAEKVANMTVELEGLGVMIETVKARLPHLMLDPDGDDCFPDGDPDEGEA